MQISFIAGTRPEIIKLAPVYHCLKAKDRFKNATLNFILTGQHKELAIQAAKDMAVPVSTMLDYKPGAIGVSEAVAGLMSCIDRHLHKEHNDLIIVQGDTNSALAGAMAGYYAGIPIAHIEAGLRSGDRNTPFPEEMNRSLIARIARLNFAPTAAAKLALINEGVPADNIALTGNTVVDAVQRVSSFGKSAFSNKGPYTSKLLVTCHRRENWGEGIRTLARVLQSLLKDMPGLQIVFPMHGNPRLREIAQQSCGADLGLKLLDPLPYADFQRTLMDADLVITDSGGIQEEATVLGIPNIIIRSQTERPESILEGFSTLCPTKFRQIRTLAKKKLATGQKPRTQTNIFGDGCAAERIVTAIDRWQSGLFPIIPKELSFHPMSNADDALQADA